ncbi:MAG: sodium/proline symporter [Oscillospiraceae bacterium]|nr:sodium/proline symporter [Oscillospiraceae bacterium]
MTTSTIGIVIAIAVYLVVVLGTGVLYSNRNKGVDDFYLGGRKLGPLVTAMSAEASDMSSWLLMGLPGVAYFSGIADAGWTAIGLAVGTYLNWLIVAKRLRRYSEISNNSITIPNFFSNRFREKKKWLTAIAAVIIIVFFVPYTASGFAACGKLFAALLNVNYGSAMLVSAVVIAIYTTLGGFLAASTTDLIQSIVMTIALVIVAVFGIHVAGGWGAVVTNAQSVAGYLSMTNLANVATGELSGYGPITIVSTLAWGLGYFGMPHILLRFMAIHDDRKIRTSRRIASVWVVISMTVAILIGMIGYAVSKTGAITTFGSGADAENIIVYIANLMSTKGIGMALIAGIILAGILASTMSTSDSQLLAAASAVSQNLLQEVFGLKLSERAAVVVARLTVLVIAVFAVFLARDPESSVFGIVSFAWAGFGAAFGPIMLFSLFWRRTNRYGAVAGMAAGGIMVFVWKYLVRPMGGAWNIYELLPAFLVSCVLIVTVSLLTPAPEQEVLDEFDRVRAMKG